MTISGRHVERLVYGGTPFQPLSVSSRAAADAIEPKAGTLRAVVLDYLRDNGPRTDEQIATELNLNPSTARPRRVELLQRGLIAPAGWGQTSSNRKAQLWDVIREPQQARLLLEQELG